MQQENIDVRVLQETKPMQGIHTRYGAGITYGQHTRREYMERGGGGGRRSGVEVEIGVAGRGRCQLRPERGKFCIDDGTSDMVRRGGIHAPKRCSHNCANVRGTSTGSKGSRDHTSGRSPRTDTRTARRVGGGTCNGGGGPRPGGHDRPLLAKASVQGKRTLDMADTEGGKAGDGVGRLRSRHSQILLFQRRGQIGEDAHRPPDGPGGDTRGGSTEKWRLHNAETRLDN